MTKKDYILIAAAIKSGKPLPSATAASVHLQIALSAAHKLQADNPRFNFGRFLAACGGQP